MQGPGPLTSSQVQIALKPLLGGEMKVYCTSDPALQLAKIQVAATNSGVYIDGAPFGYAVQALQAQANGYPMDLVVVLETPLTDVSSVAITVFGSDQNNLTQSGVAYIEVPNYSTNADNFFPPGWAADVVPTVAANQWTNFTNFAIACTAAAVGAQFSIYAMPNMSRYRLIGYTMQKGFTTRAQMPTAISGGLDEGAVIKPGVIPVGTMHVGQKWVSLAEGMARFDGSDVTVRVDCVKEQKVTDQRIFFTGAALNIAPSAGELAAVGEQQATIMYQKLLAIVAMGPGEPAE